MALPNVPRSFKNSNPLNIRPGSPYEGLATPGQDAGFAKFAKPLWGFRAAFRNYITKSDRGVNTLRKLIFEWAPPADNNDTNAYLSSVCEQTGIGPDEPISLKDWTVASAVCRAQAVVEAGAPFNSCWTESQMADGAFRAGIVNAPAPFVKRATAVAAGLGSAAGSLAVVAGSATALVQPAVVATGNLRYIVGFALISALLALIAARIQAKPKTRDQ